MASTLCIDPKNPSGGVANPPTPWMGSAMRQAADPVVIMSRTWVRSSVQASVNSSSSKCRKGLRSRYAPWTKCTDRPDSAVDDHEECEVMA